MNDCPIKLMSNAQKSVMYFTVLLDLDIFEVYEVNLAKNQKSCIACLIHKFPKYIKLISATANTLAFLQKKKNSQYLSLKRRQPL